MIVKLKKKPDSKLSKDFSAHKLRRAFIVKGGDSGKLLQTGVIAEPFHYSIYTTLLRLLQAILYIGVLY